MQRPNDTSAAIAITEEKKAQQVESSARDSQSTDLPPFPPGQHWHISAREDVDGCLVTTIFVPIKSEISTRVRIGKLLGRAPKTEEAWDYLPTLDAIVARIPEIQRALKESVTQDRQDRPSEVLRQDRPSNYHHFSNAVKSLLDERGNDNLLTSVHTKDVQADDTVSYYTPTRVPVLDDDDPNDASARSYDWRSAVTHSTHSGYDQDQLGESCTAAIRYHTGSADYDGSENIALGGSIHGKGVLRRDAGLAVSWKSVDRAHKTIAHPD